MSKEDVNETQKVVDGETEIPLVEVLSDAVSDESDSLEDHTRDGEFPGADFSDESESDPSD